VRTEDEIKNGFLETLYHDNSVKSKSRFKQLLYSTQKNQDLKMKALDESTVDGDLLQQELIG